MKSIIFTILCIILTNNATAGMTIQSRTAVAADLLNCKSGNLTYIPLPALLVGGYTHFPKNADGTLGAPQTLEWPLGAEPRNKLLTNISANVGGDDANFSTTAPIFSFSSQRRKYTIDFMKWRGEIIYDRDDHEIGWGRVGVGMRVIIDVTRSDGAASGSLLALALSAKAGKAHGTITTELIGIDAPEVTSAMPFTVDLSDGNIQKIIEALAIVKSKLYDQKTTVEPHLIARLVCSSPEKASAEE